MTVRYGTSVRAVPRRLPPSLRLALRDLRGGLEGFYVFVACVALGVAVISGVGALGEGIRSAFESQGAVLLGGDIAVSARGDQRDVAIAISGIDVHETLQEPAHHRTAPGTRGQ